MSVIFSQSQRGGCGCGAATGRSRLWWRLWHPPHTPPARLRVKVKRWPLWLLLLLLRPTPLLLLLLRGPVEEGSTNSRAVDSTVCVATTPSYVVLEAHYSCVGDILASSKQRAGLSNKKFASGFATRWCKNAVSLWVMQLPQKASPTQSAAGEGREEPSKEMGHRVSLSPCLTQLAA